MFYFNLAKNNIKKNSRVYSPYLIITSFIVLVAYIMQSVRNNSGIDSLVGSVNIKNMLGLGNLVTAIFSVIFLFYINSFIMKKRKTELGLYNVLGLDKKHIIKIIFLERVITSFITIIGGLILGIAMDKILYLVFLKLIGEGVKLGFDISSKAIFYTVSLFLVLNIILFLWDSFEIIRAKTISLLQSKNVGEKEPKIKKLSLFLGVICLVGGYFLAFNVDNPINAINMFFIAVILVMIGTYNLFLWGSIFILKMLKRNKKIYYKTNNFISISTMIYRMKKNAVGLANICILSTAVIIILSSTLSLYIGSESYFNKRYSSDIEVYARETNLETVKKIDEIIDKADVDKSSILNYKYQNNMYIREGNRFNNKNKETSNLSIDNGSIIVKIPLSDYNKFENKNITLNKNEALIFSDGEKFSYKDIEINGEKYDVKPLENVGKFYDKDAEIDIVPTYILIVNDNDLSDKFTYIYKFDVANKNNILSESNFIKSQLKKDKINVLVDNVIIAKKDFDSLYGSFLFIGLLLGSVFLFATILIIYYKQLSEGYEDKERFNIMKKVGMEDKEIRKIIKKQVSIVFLSPVALASIHLFFAYPMIKKILYTLNLRQDSIFILMTIGTVVIFLIVYSIVYNLTSKIYYKIVK
ncbi:ABC transporter permease [Clostridium thermobutyricum]|uniref:Bacitracin export permease protein BceB n=1 Tax=Clostridium thermobutyricum DSM 4928 TaxID=1121339 RepID=A0A1V4SYY4_9CLOT|nr:ABC transporter permease [Clostridium thermobutyricum]OPX49100.1 bacitracin export permease protein BceB [Clostridium thermobutyricum DSM 4928]